MAVVIFDPNAHLRTLVHDRIQHVSWPSANPGGSHGVLVLPADYAPSRHYPVVITTYHCRGFLNGGTADGAPEHVLTELGFVALCLDFNLSDYTDQEIRSIANSSLAPPRYARALVDLTSAADYLVQSGIADPHRIGVTGLSFGGNAIAYSLRRTNRFAAAAVRHFGTFEPEWLMFFPAESERRRRQLLEYNLAPENPRSSEAWNEISTSLGARDIHTPLLIQTADSEWLGSLPAFAALRANGRPVEMYVFEGESHQLIEPIHRLINYERQIDWFRFWLQGVEDPDPAKREQYARWNRLRALSNR